MGLVILYCLGSSGTLQHPVNQPLIFESWPDLTRAHTHALGPTDLPGAPVALPLWCQSSSHRSLPETGGLWASWIIPDFGSWIHRHWTVLDTGRELSGVADSPGPAFCFYQTFMAPGQYKPDRQPWLRTTDKSQQAGGSQEQWVFFFQGSSPTKAGQQKLFPWNLYWFAAQLIGPSPS